MPHYLLTGAGFSHNWGGWLADEAFEYLLGAPQLDKCLRDILWSAKLRGEGFEGALSALQNAYASNKTDENSRNLGRLTDAIIGMFTAMQSGFSKQKFNDQALRLQRFLATFDGIFTLNQDTFLEMIMLAPNGRIAGMARICLI